jgi:hypothetical protein
MTSVAKLRFVGVTIQTGIGQTHVIFFAVGTHINPFTSAHHRISPDIQQLHVFGLHVLGGSHTHFCGFCFISQYQVGLGRSFPAVVPEGKGYDYKKNDHTGND